MSSALATVYAIRHNPTGNFLPSGRGRGFTHDEPTPANVKVPRLFLSKRGAHLALRAWLEGEGKEIYSYDEFGFRETIGIIYESRPDRNPSEMEVVELRLSDGTLLDELDQEYQEWLDSVVPLPEGGL